MAGQADNLSPPLSRSPKCYVNFAWHARGDGMSDTVTDSGWKLFAQRIEKAKNILDNASSLPAKCPHWYHAMQLVAKAQGWDPRKVD